MKLVGQSLVVAGQGFSPQAITDLWVVNKKVAREDQLYAPRIATTQLAIVTTSDFTLQVFPERLQITFKDIVNYSNIQHSVDSILKSWTFGSVAACGVNCQWQLDAKEYAALLTESLRPKRNVPSLEAAEFGTIAVLKGAIAGSVMKMIITPEYEDGDPAKRLKCVGADFNFHLSLTETKEPLRQAGAFFDQYDQICDIATGIISEFVKPATAKT